MKGIMLELLTKIGKLIGNISKFIIAIIVILCTITLLLMLIVGKLFM